jgi:hypothetical protein
MALPSGKVTMTWSGGAWSGTADTAISGGLANSGGPLASQAAPVKTRLGRLFMTSVVGLADSLRKADNPARGNRLEVAMKKIFTALALAGMVIAAPAYAANICIDMRDIVSSKSTDGKTMVFKMKDGTTLVNHLRGNCPDLKFSGFAWQSHSGDTKVCENEQSFSVLQSMQICTLGKFDAPAMEKHAAN